MQKAQYQVVKLIVSLELGMSQQVNQKLLAVLPNPTISNSSVIRRPRNH